jgi:hypothetical protein
MSVTIAAAPAPIETTRATTAMMSVVLMAPET